MSVCTTLYKQINLKMYGTFLKFVKKDILSCVLQFEKHGKKRPRQDSN